MSCPVLENLRSSKFTAKMGVEVPRVCTYMGSCAKNPDACLEIWQNPGLTPEEEVELGKIRETNFLKKVAVSLAMIQSAPKNQSV